MRLGVVIPSMDNLPMLNTCLVNLAAAVTGADELEECKIIVVDNASVVPYDERQLTIPNVEILRLDQRCSFSRACNLAAARLGDCDYLFFLNNDVFLHPESIDAMLNSLRDTKSQISGTRLVYLDGKIQHSGVEFDQNSIPYHINHFVESNSYPRFIRRWLAVTGAALFVESRVFDQLSGFDERFPFGYEDIDFCLRAGLSGFFVTCAQRVDSVHLSGRTHNERTQRLLSESREIFLKRWKNQVPISSEGRN